jgi:hypothetical protein
MTANDNYVARAIQLQILDVNEAAMQHYAIQDGY